MEFVVEEDKDKFEILKSFAAARKEVKDPEKNKTNPFAKNKYADLSSVSKAAEAALNNHGMTHFHEFLPAKDGYLSVQTVLIHDKGMLKFNPLTIPVEKQTAQGMGSSITYARRYALTTNMGIIAEDDDDGNAASRHKSSNNYKHNNYGNNGNYRNKNSYNNNRQSNYGNNRNNHYNAQNKGQYSNNNYQGSSKSSKRKELITKEKGWLQQYKQVTGKSGKDIYDQTIKDCQIENVNKMNDTDFEQFVKFLVSNLQDGLSSFAKKKKQGQTA